MRKRANRRLRRKGGGEEREIQEKDIEEKSGT